jgi:hypothetical protein
VPSESAITAAMRTPSKDPGRDNTDGREVGTRLPIGVLLTVARAVAQVSSRSGDSHRSRFLPGRTPRKGRQTRPPPMRRRIERTPICVIVHVTFGPLLSFRGSRSKCRDTPAGLLATRNQAAAWRAASAKRTGPLPGQIQHVSSSARSRRAVPRDPPAAPRTRAVRRLGISSEEGLAFMQYRCAVPSADQRPPPAPAGGRPRSPPGLPSRAIA